MARVIHLMVFALCLIAFDRLAFQGTYETAIFTAAQDGVPRFNRAITDFAGGFSPNSH